MTARIDLHAVAYAATVEGDRVTITADGVWAGEGRWTGASIADCSAVLPEGVYEALEAELARAS